jgi:hypothetical protein
MEEEGKVRLDMENVSNLFGGGSKVKAARRVGLWWRGCPKTAPKTAVFCHLFHSRDFHSHLRTTPMHEKGVGFRPGMGQAETVADPSRN